MKTTKSCHSHAALNVPDLVRKEKWEMSGVGKWPKALGSDRPVGVRRTELVARLCGEGDWVQSWVSVEDRLLSPPPPPLFFPEQSVSIFFLALVGLRIRPHKCQEMQYVKLWWLLGTCNFLFLFFPWSAHWAVTIEPLLNGSKSFVDICHR